VFTFAKLLAMRLSRVSLLRAPNSALIELCCMLAHLLGPQGSKKRANKLNTVFTGFYRKTMGIYPGIWPLARQKNAEVIDAPGP
jgi:hypothetical protein